MIKPDIKIIASDQSVHAKVLNTYKRLRVFADSAERERWAEQRRKNRKMIDRNEIWTETEEQEMSDAGMVPLVVNNAVKGVQGASAVATNQQPSPIARPIGGSDLYIAELIQRGFDHVWRKNDGNGVMYKFVTEAKISGLAALTCAYDQSKGITGKIIIKNVKPTKLYFSSDSEDTGLDDTDIIIAQLRTEQYILDNYEDIKKDDLYFSSGIDGEVKTSSAVTGADNYAMGDQEKQLLQAELKQIWEIEHWELRTTTEPWVIVIEEDQYKPMPLQLEKKEKTEEAIVRIQKEGKQLLELKDGFVWMRRLQKRIQKIVVGKKLVSEIDQPYGLDMDGNPVLGTIIIKHWDTDDAYPTCPTTFALPLVKEQSKRRAQIILAASFSLGAPLVRTLGTKWIGEKGKPGSEIEIDKNTPAHAMPYRLPPESFDTSALMQLEMMAYEGINDLYDMQDVVKGKMPKGENPASGRAVLALQDKAGVMSTPFQDKLENGAITRLARIIIVLMLKHWPQYMWRQLIDEADFTRWTPDGKAEQPDEGIQQKWLTALEKVRPADMTQQGLGLLDIDVSIEAGSSLPQNRAVKEMIAVEKYKEGLYDRETALESMSDPLKDKAVKRMKEQEAAAQEAALMGLKKK